MHDAHSATGDEEWVIWNGGLGLVTTAALGRVEQGSSGRQAWLDDPFDMVGPFDLDELETHGRIAFAACIVMSRQRWQADQAELRHESIHLRRAAEQRMNEEFARFSGRRHPAMRQPTDERAHREALNLPADGKLDHRQVNTAFRKLAQKAHPDAGGSHEHFVRITKARAALLETINR
ncbi:MAG: J domain-containing protein [Rhodocyclaceae bacterium]|nr:MAG: J domain-containing protein [Rhodocyclaceae bacterium]